MIDLIGMELEAGKSLLLEQGIPFEVIKTESYPKEVPSGEYRIIQQSKLADDCRLIVCRLPDSFR